MSAKNGSVASKETQAIKIPVVADIPVVVSSPYEIEFSVDTSSTGVHQIDEPISTQPIVLPPTVAPTVEIIDLLDTDEINTIWVSSCRTWLVLQGSNVYAQQGLGSVLIGVMSKKGLVRNTALKGSDSLGLLVTTANAKWNPVSKAIAAQNKIDTQNKKRDELADLFS